MKIFIKISIFVLILSAGRTLPAAEEEYLCRDCNVILISQTNLRADHLSLYGYDRATSPHLDAWAQSALVFEEAYTVASWTLPAANSLFTSLYPFSHKVMMREKINTDQEDELVHFRLAEDTVTLFDIFRENSYTTISINSGVDYYPRHWLTRRSDYGVSFAQDPSRNWGQYGSIFEVIPEAIDWLEKNHKSKFFMHLQGYDTHCPFAYPRENRMFDPDYKGDFDFSKCYWTFNKTDPVEIEKDGVKKKYYMVKSPRSSFLDKEFKYGRKVKRKKKRRGNSIDYNYKMDERDRQHMIALYDGEIHDSDSQWGRLFQRLEELKLTKKTIVIFLSEHGDMFGKYGRFMRGGPLRGTFYNDVLHVPLIIYHPQIKSQRIKSPVSLVDIAPTILEFLGISPPPQFAGESLVKVLSGEFVDKKIYAGSLYMPAKFSDSRKQYFKYPTIISAVKDGKYKLIQEVILKPNKLTSLISDTEKVHELYNLEEDPQELNNIFEKKSEVAARLLEALETWIVAELKMPLPELIRKIEHDVGIKVNLDEYNITSGESLPEKAFQRKDGAQPFSP